MLDQTSFAKYLVQGRDATALLGQLCANDVDVDVGRLVYTQWLNERGGIESDLTVCRLADPRSERLDWFHNPRSPFEGNSD